MRDSKNKYEVENRLWLIEVFSKAAISQAEVARRMKLTTAAVSRWKKTGQISGENIMMLCSILDCSPPAWFQKEKLEEGAPRYVNAVIQRIQELYEAGGLTVDDLLHLERMALHIAGLRQALEKKG